MLGATTFDNIIFIFVAIVAFTFIFNFILIIILINITVIISSIFIFTCLDLKCDDPDDVYLLQFRSRVKGHPIMPFDAFAVFLLYARAPKDHTNNNMWGLIKIMGPFWSIRNIL